MREKIKISDEKGASFSDAAMALLGILALILIMYAFGDCKWYVILSYMNPWGRAEKIFFSKSPIRYFDCDKIQSNRTERS